MVKQKKIIDNFLIRAYDAVINPSGSMKRITQIIQDLPSTQDVDEIVNQITQNAWAEVIQQKRRELQQKKRKRIALRWIGLIFIILIIFAVVAFFIYRENPDRWIQVVNGTYTPTVTVTPTMTATLTPTPTATATPTLTPTPTLIPLSSFLVTDPASVYPAPPLSASEIWIIDEMQALVDPPLDNADIWTSAASTDANAAGQPYYYNEVGNVTINWRMDQPLNAGLYGVYILDTVENSTGIIKHTVKLDGIDADPYRGHRYLGFDNIPNQEEDTWLLLGFYDVSQAQNFDVEVIVPTHNEEQPFAIDRMMLVRISETQEKIISALPSGRNLFSLLDDDRAVFYTRLGDLPLQEKYQGVDYGGVLSWNDEFRSLDSGDNWVTIANEIGVNLRVDWNSAGRLPIGKYELMVWIPAEHAIAIVDFELIANGEVIERDNPAQINQQDHSGEWVSLGIWDLAEPAAVSVRMNVSQSDQINTTVEIGIDAVALLLVID